MLKKLLFRSFDENNQQVEGFLHKTENDFSYIINSYNEKIKVDKERLGIYLTTYDNTRLYSGDVITVEYSEAESGVRHLTKDYEHLKNASKVSATTYYNFLTDEFETVAWFSDQNDCILEVIDGLYSIFTNTNFTKYLMCKNYVKTHIKEKQYFNVLKHLDTYYDYKNFKYFYQHKQCIIDDFVDFEYVMINDKKIHVEDVKLPVYTFIYNSDYLRTMCSDDTNLFKYNHFKDVILSFDENNEMIKKIEATGKINDYSDLKIYYKKDEFRETTYNDYKVKCFIEFKSFGYLNEFDLLTEEERKKLTSSEIYKKEHKTFEFSISNKLIKKIALYEQFERENLKNPCELKTLDDLKQNYITYFKNLQ